MMMASDGETVIKRWSKVTDFPYEVSVSKIKNETSGTLVITWHFLDEDGNADTDVQEEDVTFK